MSIAKNASRFDFLPDDAGDPFETANKKSNKKKSSGAGDAKNKTAKKGNSNSDRKQLQSLAFGSASEGKKKKAAAQPQSQQNGNSNNNDGNGSLSSSSSTKESNSDIPAGVREVKNGNSSEKNSALRPKKGTGEQWEEWQKRDANYTDEAYVTDLQKALLQSKLDFDTEQKNKPLGKGKKKKPVAVPLNEFNARLNETGLQPTANVMNGAFVANPSFGSDTGPYQSPDDGEELVERFRMEAKLEIERERQKALERQLLMSRQPPPQPVPRSAEVNMSSSSAIAPVDEKDLIINQLQEENLRLKTDVGMLKDRVKTINNYLQAAQEVKDKAKLVYELDNMTKANKDLHEELREVHSQLEQERSRSSAAMLELRRMLENRRRTTTEGSNS